MRRCKPRAPSVPKTLPEEKISAYCHANTDIIPVRRRSSDQSCTNFSVCVDPWLLNVSGQCPLCRTDFNPPTTVADACTESDIIDPDRREYVPRANQGGVGLVLTNSRNPFERYLHLVRSRNSGRHPSDVVDMHTLEGLRQEMNRNHHHHSTRRPLNRMFSGSRRQQEGRPHSSAASRTTEFPAHEQPFHAFGHMIGPP